MSRLLFLCAQDALKGRPTVATVLTELGLDHVVETALMYPALLGLKFYRDALEDALVRVHDEIDNGGATP